ncbi:hypothetical protein [Sphingomonas arenae]|uniref:hypothetical protein n=1 Tax=Sphingomonas arenae TaxID=2812555 RepID=UPI001966E01F|nr:hypothetical protein [Sphingomonas arenae]
MAKSNRFSSSTTTSLDNDFETGGSTSSGAREKVSNLGSTASQRIDSSPLIALGAGAALGAVLGAVLPRSEKEKQLLAPLGTKLADAGTSAIDRARETGKQKFDEMAGDSVRQFFGASSSSSSDTSSSSNDGPNA